jgi:hypothetical protein
MVWDNNELDSNAWYFFWERELTGAAGFWPGASLVDLRGSSD